MFIGTVSCSGKCCIEAGLPITVCQNSKWNQANKTVISDKDIIMRYLQNPISKAICFGGLEPFEQFDELLSFIFNLRMIYQCNDLIIIYTGYTERELVDQMYRLRKYPNIMIKFGRYVPQQQKHYDPLLGVNLASSNQYAKWISSEVAYDNSAS